jgi:hypothetical protein
MGNSPSATISNEVVTNIIASVMTSQVTKNNVSLNASTYVNQLVDGETDGCKNIAKASSGNVLFASTSIYKDGQIVSDTHAEITNKIMNELKQTNQKLIDLSGGEAAVENKILNTVASNLTVEQMDIMNSKTNNDIVIKQTCTGNAINGMNYAEVESNASSQNIFNGYMSSDVVQSLSADITNDLNNKVEQENTSPLTTLFYAIIIIAVVIGVVALIVGGIGLYGMKKFSTPF